MTNLTPQKKSVEERFDDHFGAFVGIDSDKIIKTTSDEVKAFLLSEIALVKKEILDEEIGDWKDSYKGKLWSTCVEKAFTAPFQEVAVQYLLKRIDEKHQIEITLAEEALLERVREKVEKKNKVKPELHADNLEARLLISCYNEGVSDSLTIINQEIDSIKESITNINDK